MVMITASHTLRWHSWMVHVLTAGNMTISVLRSRIQYLEETGAPSYIPRSSFSSGPAQKKPTSVNNLGGPEGYSEEYPAESISSGSSLLHDTATSGASKSACWSVSCGTSSHFWGSPGGPDVNHCVGGWAYILRGWRFGCTAPFGCGSVARVGPRDGCYAFPGHREHRARVEPPPCPELSRLDDWFLGVARAGSQRSAPVPFFPEVHEEVTKSSTAPFSARSRSGPSSSLTTLDGGVAKGYVELPPVERSMAIQLCPKTATSWRGNPRLPSRACKFSSSLVGKAYTACGEAASTLHAMALLQVYQARALKELHEGSSDPGVMQELHTAMDLALRVTKVTTRSLGQAMSTLVVQERHLWLNLADMREPDKVRFLNAPVCQAGLFGDAVENFAQQFSVAQKQTEAIKHILPRRPAAASTQSSAAAPPSARRRGRPPLRPPPPLLSLSSSLHLDGRWPAARGTPSPSRPPSNPAASIRVSGPEMGDPEVGGSALREMVSASLPPLEEGRVENLLFPLFLFRRWLLGV